MPVHIRVGGVWKQCDAVHLRTGGAWKQLDQAHIRTGGVWKESLALPSDLLVTNINLIDTFAGFAAMSCTFKNWGWIQEGSVQRGQNQVHAGEYLITEPIFEGSLYEIRCASMVTGTWSVQPAAVGTWISISSDRQWAAQQFVVGWNIVQGNMEIREIANPSNIVTFTMMLTAHAT